MVRAGFIRRENQAKFTKRKWGVYWGVKKNDSKKGEEENRATNFILNGVFNLNKMDVNIFQPTPY